MMGTVVFLSLCGGANATAAPTSSSLKEAFAAVRTAPVTSASAAARRFIDSADGAKAGVDARNVHRIAAPGGGFWSVLPGDDQLCIVLENHEAITACASTQKALEGELRAMLIAPRASGSAVAGKRTLVGLAPDNAGAPLTSAYEAEVSATAAARIRGAAARRGPTSARAAGTGYYYFCPSWCNFSSSQWSSVLPITNEGVWSGDGNWLCGNTVNSDGSWAGTTFCSNSLTKVWHAYNGSNRTGWAGPGTAGVTTLGNAVVAYNN